MNEYQRGYFPEAALLATFFNCTRYPLYPEDDALLRKRRMATLSATSNSRGSLGQIVNGTTGGALGGGFITGTDEGATISVLDHGRGSGTGGGAIGKGGPASPGGLDM